MQNLATVLFESLRAMDAECPTGLCDYGQFAGKGSQQVELGCHIGLRRHLGSRQVAIDHNEWHYPGGMQRCDLRLITSTDMRVLIESKILWRRWFYEIKKPRRPHCPKLSDLHYDIETKLGSVTKNDADAVAVLVIGFDSADGSLDRRIQAEKDFAASLGWQTYTSDSWLDARCPDCRICAWFWWREIGHTGGHAEMSMLRTACGH